MDYQQVVSQTAADDYPNSGLAGGHCKAILHEPGLFLHMKNFIQPNTNIARLAAILHCNSVMSFGEGRRVEGMPDIPLIGGLPIGRFEDISTQDYDFRAPKGKEDEYLYPSRHNIDNPFMADVPASVTGFPGFSPASMNAILTFANELLTKSGVDIEQTTVLTIDNKFHDGGISNARSSSGRLSR